MIHETKIHGQEFRAWKTGESIYYPYLATIVLPSGTEVFKDEEIWPLFIAQNGLKDLGIAGNPKFDSIIRMVSIRVSAELANAIQALGGKAGLGYFTVTCETDMLEQS